MPHIEISTWFGIDLDDMQAALDWEAEQSGSRPSQFSHHHLMGMLNSGQSERNRITRLIKDWKTATGAS
tara:strand:- start:121 stop:327 length:207 start_codon:yes stop_codon:yes gene_type:complete